MDIGGSWGEKVCKLVALDDFGGSILAIVSTLKLNFASILPRNLLGVVVLRLKVAAVMRKMVTKQDTGIPSPPPLTNRFVFCSPACHGRLMLFWPVPFHLGEKNFASVAR